MFGGKKLPEMMRGLGQGVREFKKGVNEINDASDTGNVGGATPSSPNNDTKQETVKTNGDEGVAASTNNGNSVVVPTSTADGRQEK